MNNNLKYIQLLLGDKEYLANPIPLFTLDDVYFDDECQTELKEVLPFIDHYNTLPIYTRVAIKDLINGDFLTNLKEHYPILHWWLTLKTNEQAEKSNGSHAALILQAFSDCIKLDALIDKEKSPLQNLAIIANAIINFEMQLADEWQRVYSFKLVGESLPLKERKEKLIKYYESFSVNELDTE